MTVVSGFEKIVRREEPLAERTWLKLGGPAQFFAEPNSVEELAALVRRCREEEVPIRVMGGASNLLIRDEGVRGIVISLTSSNFTNIEIHRCGPRIHSGQKLIVITAGNDLNISADLYTAFLHFLINTNSDFIIYNVNSGGTIFSRNLDEFID